jgi:hypothetical protein
MLLDLLPDVHRSSPAVGDLHDGRRRHRGDATRPGAKQPGRINLTTNL